MPTIRASRDAFKKLVIEAKKLNVSVTDLVDMYVLHSEEEVVEEDEEEEDEEEE